MFLNGGLYSRMRSNRNEFALVFHFNLFIWNGAKFFGAIFIIYFVFCVHNTSAAISFARTFTKENLGSLTVKFGNHVAMVTSWR